MDSTLPAPTNVIGIARWWRRRILALLQSVAKASVKENELTLQCGGGWGGIISVGSLAHEVASLFPRIINLIYPHYFLSKLFHNSWVWLMKMAGDSYMPIWLMSHLENSVHTEVQTSFFLAKKWMYNIFNKNKEMNTRHTKVHICTCCHCAFL